MATLVKSPTGWLANALALQYGRARASQRGLTQRTAVEQQLERERFKRYFKAEVICFGSFPAISGALRSGRVCTAASGCSGDPQAKPERLSHPARRGAGLLPLPEE